MKDEERIKILSGIWAAKASAFLEEELPGVTAGGAASFYAQAGAEMIANMFSMLHLMEKEGMAEGFLRKTLDLIPVKIRLKGVPVLAAITLELHSAAQDPEPEAPATPAQGPCCCMIKDGGCPVCIEALSAEYRQFARAMMARLTTAGEQVQGFLSNTKSCRQCFPAASDQAIAGLVPEWIPELVFRPELVPVIATGLLEVAVMGGLVDAPLTKSALQDNTWNG